MLEVNDDDERQTVGSQDDSSLALLLTLVQFVSLQIKACIFINANSMFGYVHRLKQAQAYRIFSVGLHSYSES
jgi:hypothetical protein